MIVKAKKLTMYYVSDYSPLPQPIFELLLRHWIERDIEKTSLHRYITRNLRGHLHRVYFVKPYTNIFRPEVSVYHDIIIAHHSNQAIYHPV